MDAPNMNALAAARAAGPIIMQSRRETERARRLPEPLVEHLRDTGLCRMALAAEVHGLQAHPAEMLQVWETLARYEASASWIVWNNALPCCFSRFLAPAARAEIFGDPRSLYACSTRPSGRAAVDGAGYRITGRWSLVSGCELAEWILLTCVVEDRGEPLKTESGAPQVRLVYVRRSELEIIDTWDAGGLRGTGSHDVVVQDRHVPRSHTVSPGEPSTLDGPLGRIPIICTMVAGYGAVALGIGQAAVDTLVGLTRTKVQIEPGPSLNDRPTVLAAIAREEARLEAARRYVHGRVSELWDAAAARAATLEEIAAVWGAALHAMDAGHHALDTMYAAGGTSSLYADCPLERAHRDMHALLRHVAGQPMWLEDAGRVRLGMRTNHPLFAV
jgi:alkylation response protein AidB-like acyl-CoA dehydrogenase